MKITLDSQIQAKPDNRIFDISHKVTSIANSQHRLDKDFMYEIINESPNSTLNNSGLVGLLSYCYSKHLPVAIAPHDVWVLILSEITKEVAQKSNLYGQFFTKSTTKEEISVPSGSMTEIPIDTLSHALSEKVLFNTDLIFKNFSTETTIVKETIQAIFCDMASPYYSYSMFCCGIPSIQLLGSVEDWTKLEQAFYALVHEFNTPTLHTYLEKALSILQQFVQAAKGEVDIDFWKDIFTQKNVGSGGDLTINGWITKLFITNHSFAKITNFSNTHGIVKYKHLQSNEEFVAVYGGFDSQVNKDGFYELVYRKFTLQKVPYKYTTFKV